VRVDAVRVRVTAIRDTSSVRFIRFAPFDLSVRFT
jgi:hypothetical protein